MAITEKLEFDISDADSAIDKLDKSLGEAVTSFKVNLADALDLLNGVQLVVQTPDTAPITEAIDAAIAAAPATVDVTGSVDETGITSDIDSAINAADTTVSVTADTSTLESTIDATVTNITPPEIDIPVAFDPPTDQINELSGSLHKAGEETRGLEDATAALSVASAVAVGEAGALNEGLSELGAGGAAAAAGIAAITGAVAEFAHAGFDAASAEFRLDQALGPLAGSIDSIHVGSLNADLGTLANSLGSTEASVKNAAATLVNMGVAAGVTKQQAESTAETFIALGARAIALNPALGTVESVTSRLSTALARGGRFAQQYGIQLSSAQINAEALSETGKTSASDLTIYEKAVAGATLATQKYGDTLDQVIAQGTKNPELQLRSIKARFDEVIEAAGKPLVAPILDLLNKLEPAAEEVAKGIGELVAELVPLADEILPQVGPLLDGVTGALKLVVPVAQVFADIIGEIPGPIITLAGAFFTLKAGLEGLQGLKSVQATLGFVSSGFDKLTGSAAETAAAAEAAGGAVGASTIVTEEAATAAALAAGASEEQAAAYAQQAVAASVAAAADDELVVANEAAEASLGPIGIALAAATALFVAFGLSSDGATASSRALDEELRKLHSSLADVKQPASIALHTFVEDLINAKGSDLPEVLKTLGLTADQLTHLLGGGTEALDAYLGRIKSTSGAVQISKGALSDLGDKVAEEAHHQLEAVAAQDSSTASLVRTQIAINTSKDGHVNYIAAIDGVNRALGTQVDSDGKVVTAEQAAEKAAQAATQQAEAQAKAYNDLAAKAPAVAEAVTAVVTTTGDETTNLANLAIAADKAGVSQDELAAIASRLGVSTDQLTTFFKNATDQIKALDDQVFSTLPKLSDIGTSTFDDASTAAQKTATTIKKAQLDVEQAGVRLDKAQQAANTATAENAKQASIDVQNAQLDLDTANQGLVDAQAKTADALNPSKLLGDVQSEIDAVTTFQTNLETFVSSGLDHVAKLAAQKGPEFAKQLGAAIKADPSFGANLEAKLGEADGIVQGFETHFKTDLTPQILAATGDLGTLTGGQIGAGLKEGVGAATQDPAVQSAVNSAIKHLSPFFSDGGKALGGDVNAGLASALGGPTTEAATNALSPVAQSILDQFSPLLGTTGTELGGILSAGVAGGITTGAIGPQGPVNATGELASTMHDSNVSNFADAGTKLGGDVQSGLSTQLSAPSPQVTSALNSLPPSITALVGPLLSGAGGQLGQDLAAGFAAGINQGAVAPLGPIDAAGKMADGTIAAARFQVQARSPSRVFMELGSDITKGLAIGLEDSTHFAITAAITQAEAVTTASVDAFKKAQQSAPLASALAPSALASQAQSQTAEVVAQLKVNATTTAATPTLIDDSIHIGQLVTPDPYTAANEVLRQKRSNATRFSNA